ncbi:MAG: lysostaphin resistance A-like protein [Marinifilaceae bacterium]
MLKASFKDSSPANQMLLSGCTMVLSFLVMLFITSIGAYLFFGVNIFTQPEALNTMNKDVNLPLLKYYQVMYSLGLFVIPPFLLAYLFHHRISEYLCLNVSAKRTKYVLAALLTILALPLINLMAEFNSHLSLPDFLSGVEEWMRNSEENVKVITEKFLEMKTTGDLMINLFMIALIPALGEELLFRGIFQKLITKWTNNKHAGIILAAMAFSALHLQFFGFLPRMMMGILFGYLLIWTGSLWIPIVAHFINNSMAVIFYFLVARGYFPEEVNNIGSTDNGWAASIISLALTGYLVFFFYRTRKR